jgi:poly-gamma-glutamate synthesis protein (capsule biosynthesis protein)
MNPILHFQEFPQPKIRKRYVTTYKLKTLFVFLICITLSLSVPVTGSGKEITLAAVGDVFFARGVAAELKTKPPSYLFADVQSILSKADIAVCNLECTLSTKGLPQRRKMVFRVSPSYAHALKAAGIDVADLANNHTLDYGRDALVDTYNAIESAGLVSVGAGKDRSSAIRVRIVKRGNLKVGFIAYTDLATSGVIRLDDQPTVAGVNDDQIPAEVKAAKFQCDALIVMFHWGVEYMKTPTQRQKMLARLCIDSGADAVLGHHPHVLQPTEVYKNRPIIYSSGAFVWDSKLFGANKSAIYLLKISKNQARLIKTIPLKITHARPTPVKTTIKR